MQTRLYVYVYLSRIPFSYTISILLFSLFLLFSPSNGTKAAILYFDGITGAYYSPARRSGEEHNSGAHSKRNRATCCFIF